MDYYSIKLRQALFNEILVKFTYLVGMIADQNFCHICFTVKIAPTVQHWPKHLRHVWKKNLLSLCFRSPCAENKLHNLWKIILRLGNISDDKGGLDLVLLLPFFRFQNIPISLSGSYFKATYLSKNEICKQIFLF